MDQRLDALEAQLGDLRIALGRLETENATLRRGRTVAVALALMALGLPLLAFTGLVSPRFRKIVVQRVEAEGLSAKGLFLTDGDARVTLLAGGQSASLHLSSKGASVTANAGSDGFVAVSAADQHIWLNASNDAVLGATVITTSKDVRGALVANRNTGEEAKLSLDAGGVSTTSVARLHGDKKFAGGVGIQRPGLTGVHLGLSASESHLDLEAGADGKTTDRTSLRVDMGPSLSLSHYGPKGTIDTAVGISAMASRPWIYGLVGDKTVFELKAPPPL